MPSSNTINVINQLEKLRSIQTTLIAREAIEKITIACAFGRGYIHSLFSFHSVTAFANAGFFSIGAFASKDWLNLKYQQGSIFEPLNESELLNFLELIMPKAPNMLGWTFVGVLLGVALNAYTQFPIHYNLLLPHLNAKFFNSFRTIARSNLSELNIFSKNWYFDNGKNVSLQEANKLYQSFHQFCTIHNGFNTSAANDHDAFLEFLTKNQRLDDLYCLKQLGADAVDCENKVAAVSCGRYDLDFPASKSLFWLSAKAAASAQYTKDDLVNRGLNKHEVGAVEAARKFALI